MEDKQEKGDQASPLIAKWFKPTTHAHAADAYWDLHDECIKNASDCMLNLTNMDTDDLYWAAEVATPTPKRKGAQADDKSLDDLVSTVKTVATSEAEALLKIVHLPYYYNLVQTKIINSHLTKLIW